MAEVPEEAYRLQAQAEQWQDVVAKQQDVALRLRELVVGQHELASLWGAAGATELMSEAQAIANALRETSARLVRLEQEAVDKIANAIADAGRELRPK